jgi:hypothetical protein
MKGVRGDVRGSKVHRDPSEQSIELIHCFDQLRQSLRLCSLDLLLLHLHLLRDSFVSHPLEDDGSLSLDVLPQGSETTEEQLGVDRRLVRVDLFDTDHRGPVSAPHNRQQCIGAEKEEDGPQDLDERLSMQVDSGVGLRRRVSSIVSVSPMLSSEREPASSSPSSAPISNGLEVDSRRTVSRVGGRLNNFPLAGGRALAFVHDGIAVDRSFLDERYLVFLSFVSLRGCTVASVVWSSSIGWAVESSASSSASRGVDEEGRHVGW